MTDDAGEPLGLADPSPIAEALARHGVDYIVIGGYAVIAHGYPRTTRDLDITPDPDPRNIARLARAMAELVPGFELPGGRSPEGVEELGFGLAPVVPLRTRHGMLDLVLRPEGAPGGYEELKPRSIEVAVAGARLRVVGLSDLIRLKRALGREQDLADIAALTEAERRRPA